MEARPLAGHARQLAGGARGAVGAGRSRSHLSGTPLGSGPADTAGRSNDHATPSGPPAPGFPAAARRADADAADVRIWRRDQLLLAVIEDLIAENCVRYEERARREVDAAEAEGLLAPADPERDAWLVIQLIMTVFHHHAFATSTRPVSETADHVWNFCLTALGGRLTPPGG